MVRSTLLDHVPMCPEAVHRIRGELGPGRAASEYDRLVAGIETLDLAVLGAGADGHTASLFPGQLEPDDDRWARGVRAPTGVEPRERVTLTLHALNAFAHVLFLVTGRAKRGVVSALEKARRAGVDAEAPPVVRVRPATEPLWIVDTEAAGW
jgi:6-phosphogluconolactonase